MNIFKLFSKKPEVPPEEELRHIKFKLADYNVIDREKLQRRKEELEKLLAEKSSTAS